jgi:hypothetical protein
MLFKFFENMTNDPQKLGTFNAVLLDRECRMCQRTLDYFLGKCKPYEKVEETHLATIIRKLMAPSMLGPLEAKDFEGLTNWYR